LEKILGWRGILIEPIPELYERCNTLRRRSEVYNCALVADDFEESTVDIHYANLMSVVDGSLKSSERQASHIQKAFENQNILKSYTVKIHARKLESILEKISHSLEIDFMSLDVEGYELNALKGLNISKYKPKYILVEANFPDEINEFLKNDYDLIEMMTHHDYFYRRKN
jgi:FkbM family methyltransferase